LKKEKCEFSYNEIKSLGHLSTSAGIKPDPEKFKSILDISPPTNKTEARPFTGLVN